MPELDFGDIAGKEIQKVSSKPKQEKHNKCNKSTGTILSIPTNEPNVWIQKDLSDCSGEEFVDWAREVYPIDLSSNIEVLNNLSSRVMAFRNILQYHINPLFYVNKRKEITYN